MQIDTFEYPVDWQKAYIHRKANFLGKKMFIEQNEIQDYGECQYCNRKIGYLPQFECCMDIKDRFSTYGPNVVLYFQIAKKIIWFLIFCTLFFGIPAMVINSTGEACIKPDNKCQYDNFVDYWAIVNALDNDDKLLAQLILWLIICILIVPFNLYLRIFTKHRFNEIDEENVTEADYSIIIRSLPADTTQQDIQKLIQQMREDLTPFQKEQSDNLEIVNIDPIHKMKVYTRANAQNIELFKKYIKLGKPERFRPEQLPKFRGFSGTAIVSFNSAFSNNFINYDVKCKENMISYFFPFYKPAGKYSVKEQFVSVQKAPEPTDIIWSHFGYSEKDRIWRKIKYFLLTGIVLLISAGISYGLAQSRTAFRNLGYSLIGFQVFQVLVSFLFNLIISKILYTSTRLQKLDTFTDEKVELMQKVSFYQTINLGFFTLIVPFLAEIPDTSVGLQEVSITSNVIIVIVIQVLAQSVATFFVKYTELILSIYRFLVQSKLIIKTQTQSNLAFQGRQLGFVNHFVYILRTVWFSLVFSIISPICLFIGTIGLILSYFVEKYLISQKYSIPQYGDYRLNAEFIDLLDATPILIGLFNLFVRIASTENFDYTQIPTTHSILIMLCIGIGGINFFMPWNEIMRKAVTDYEKDIEIRYQDAAKDFEITYNQINPSTRIGIKLERIENRMLKKLSKKYKTNYEPKTSRELIQKQEKGKY